MWKNKIMLLGKKEKNNKYKSNNMNNDGLAIGQILNIGNEVFCASLITLLFLKQNMLVLKKCV